MELPELVATKESAYGRSYPPAHCTDSDIALLSSLPLFVHVPLELLASIPYEDVLRYYHDGDVILQQGDQADRLVILLHGQARVLTGNIFLTARKPYDVLGELAFINQTTRNATVIAQGTVQALVLHAALGFPP